MCVYVRDTNITLENHPPYKTSTCNIEHTHTQNGIETETTQM